jgi:coenzyme F420-reducing hydrogenase alpha subunit
MADTSKQAWNEVGSRFSSVGKRLADRYQAGAKDDTSTKEPQHKVEEVAREIGNQLDRAFDALDDTMRDPEARADLKTALGALGTAITTSVNEAAEAIKNRASNSTEPPRPDDA